MPAYAHFALFLNLVVSLLTFFLTIQVLITLKSTFILFEENKNKQKEAGDATF